MGTSSLQAFKADVFQGILLERLHACSTDFHSGKAAMIHNLLRNRALRLPSMQLCCIAPVLTPRFRQTIQVHNMALARSISFPLFVTVGITYVSNPVMN